MEYAFWQTPWECVVFLCTRSLPFPSLSQPRLGGVRGAESPSCAEAVAAASVWWSVPWPGSVLAAGLLCCVMRSMCFQPAVINEGIWWAGKDSPDGSAPSTVTTWSHLDTRDSLDLHQGSLDRTHPKALARNIPCRQPWHQGFSSSRWGSPHSLLLHCWDLRQEKGPLEIGTGFLVSVMIISRWTPGRSSKFISPEIRIFLPN